MKKLFSRSKSDQKNSEEPEEAPEGATATDAAEDEAPKKSKRKSVARPVSDDLGSGDPEASSHKSRTKSNVLTEKQDSYPRRVRKQGSEEPERLPPDQPEKPPKPIPRKVKGSTTTLFSPTDSEEELDENVVEPEKEKKVKKESKAKRKKRPPLKNDSSSELDVIKYVSVKEGNIPKIESVRGNVYSTVYNYKQSTSQLKFRARLLKYPSVTDQQLWTGELAVIDERTFHWQEKVFSKSEAKRYQKLANCLTDHENKYHDELSNSSKSIGKYLSSYINEDLYVSQKKAKLLVRRCPVEHELRKENRVTGNGEFGNGDHIGEEELYESDDSLDFSEPISSSTPVQKRRDIVRQEKKATERKEKDSREREKSAVKAKEMEKKKEKAEEKKRLEAAAKLSEKSRKLEDFESKEKELRAQYMKKYKYSKRPSIPLGARMRPVRLSPGKHHRKKKSVSSEMSEVVADELSAPSLESVAEKQEKVVGHQAFAPEYNKCVIGTEKGQRCEVETEVMYIMAQIPYLPGKFREVIVTKIQHVPSMRVLVFKPTLGYRNIEAKRNAVFRISCELVEDETQKGETTMRRIRRSKLFTDIGIFESIPKNEFRIAVLGEVTSAMGFDASPLCIYYTVDIPKGWRNDSVSSNTEGMTHSCFTNNNGIAHFSHEFSFQLVFSMDFFVEPQSSYPSPVIALMVVSMNPPSPRIIYEGYGFITVPMRPGCHYVKIRTWKPRPRTIVEKMRATFLDISPSLQDIKFCHFSSTDTEDGTKPNLVGLQTIPSGVIKLRMHVIHQTPPNTKDLDEGNLDLLEKMSSATILKSVQAVIHAFQKAREKAENVKSQYN